jgi:hypothetical protein
VTLRFRIIWVVLLATGCASPFQQGVQAYTVADYSAAARAFDRAKALGVPAPEAARLLLYSGLTFLALGDARAAAQDLARARRALEEKPGRFSREERSRLETAWMTLGFRPGDRGIGDRSGRLNDP